MLEMLKGNKDFLAAKEIAVAALEVNPNAKVYLVGGIVRDIILNVNNKDVDIEIHGISENNLANILSSKFGETNVDLVGAKFGVYKVKSYDLDIALPRLEVKTGEGHRDFEVKVCPEIGTYEASRRRDFTFGSLMIDVLSGEMINHFNGLEHIQKGIIQHVCETSFREDALRVLRASQFSSRFDFQIATETIDLCKEIVRSGEMNFLSKERFAEEFRKIFKGKAKVGNALSFLKEIGYFSKSIDISKVSVKNFNSLVASLELQEEGFAEKILTAKLEIKLIKDISEVATNLVKAFEEGNEIDAALSLREAICVYSSIEVASKLTKAEFVPWVMTIIKRMSSIEEISGIDLIKIGMKPGPHFKTIMKDVFISQFKGETKENAFNLVNSNFII